MNNPIKISCVIILSVLANVSCSDTEKDIVYPKESVVDFGEGTYRPTPLGLENIPPFSWLEMPDTVIKEVILEIAFNEDAVRSNSGGKLFFVDSNGNKIDGIIFTESGKNEYNIKADSKPSIIPVSYKVNPIVGDSLIQGSILVLGENLDNVNDVTLLQTTTPVAVWQLNYQTGINWWRWLILILFIAIFLVILYYIGYGVWLGANYFVYLFSNLKLQRIHNKRRKNKQKKKKSKKQCPCENEKQKILEWEKYLYSTATVFDKYETLEKMRIKFDEYYAEFPECYIECKEAVKNNTWSALEELRTLWNPTPKSNVDWVGPNQQTCVLMRSHPQYTECAKLGMLECTYDEHGSPDFSKGTMPGSVVDISDLYDSLSINDIHKRGGSADSLQEVAQMRMAKNLKQTIEKWARKNNQKADFWVWRNAHDLVPHEDTNCRTMRLVYRPVHLAFKHRGGVANAITIKSYFG